jgi:mannose-6-phosphate isomerase-like protein (cupin superfamily)
LKKTDLHEKLASFDDVYVPKIVGELNDQYVKVAKVRGDYPWHHHADEDELFLVLKGSITIRFRDGDVKLGEGEMCIVPRGVEHSPTADEEAHILLFEPVTTRNPGNVAHAYTIEAEDVEQI